MTGDEIAQIMNIDNAREQLRMQGVVNTINGLNTVDTIQENRATFPFRLSQQESAARTANINANRLQEELLDYVDGRTNRQAVDEATLLGLQRDNAIKLQALLRNTTLDSFLTEKEQAAVGLTKEQARGERLDNDAKVAAQPYIGREIEARLKILEETAEAAGPKARFELDQLRAGEELTDARRRLLEQEIGEYIEYPIYDRNGRQIGTSRRRTRDILADMVAYHRAIQQQSNADRTNRRLQRGQDRQESSDAASAEFNILNKDKTPKQRAVDIPRFNSLSTAPYVYYYDDGGGVFDLRLEGIKKLPLPVLSQNEIDRFGFNAYGIKPGQLVARDATALARQSGMSEQEYVPQLIEMLQVLRRNVEEGGK